MKKVSFWAFPAISQAIAGFAQNAEIFGEHCRLQTHRFFSIGHSFAALAFVVSGSGKLIERCAPRLAAIRTCSSNPKVRAA
jgi:hypothetical protein